MSTQENANRIATEITRDTVRHMAEKAGVSFNVMVDLIVTDAAANKRYNEYLSIAIGELVIATVRAVNAAKLPF